MQPTVPLKYAAVAFAVMWMGGMVWWSGIFEPANIIILSICGAAAGYFWYRVMRWWFHRRNLLPHDGDGADAGAGR